MKKKPLINFLIVNIMVGANLRVTKFTAEVGMYPPKFV